MSDKNAAKREVHIKHKKINRIIMAWVFIFAIAIIIWFGDALIDKIFFHEESYEEIAETNVSVFEIYFRSSLILLLAVIGFITTRRMLEKAESEELIKFEREQTLRIFDSIDEQIYIIDVESHEVLYKNKKVEQIFGPSEGKKCDEYFTTHGENCSKCSMKAMVETGENAMRTREFYNSKSDRWYHGIERLIKWIDGRNAVYTILIDITERKRTEVEAYRASKVETLEVIAGSIVHDFSNALTTIIMSLSLAKHISKENEKLYSLITMAENAAFKAKDITHQLLTFGRPVEMALKHAHMEKMIRETTDFVLKATAIKYSVESEKNLPLVEVDVNQIAQVMNNLLINAKQAVGENGEIKVTLSSCMVTHKDALPLNEGKYLMISVKDNGTGISSRIIHKIFDSYFTTKKEGSGLGLASCYMIMNRHNGYIKVESLEGQGSTFTLYIPASDERRQQKDEERASVLRKPINGIIIDDDEMSANVTALMMNYGGNRIDAANSFIKAEELIASKKKNKESYDVIILDNTLPGDTDPVEAMDRMRKTCLNCRFVLLQSVADEAKTTNYLEQGFDLVINKPVRPEVIIKEINEILK
ncbi:MAG: ATP-binding protein [bacterium]